MYRLSIRNKSYKIRYTSAFRWAIPLFPALPFQILFAYLFLTRLKLNQKKKRREKCLLFVIWPNSLEVGWSSYTLSKFFDFTGNIVHGLRVVVHVIGQIYHLNVQIVWYHMHINTKHTIILGSPLSHFTLLTYPHLIVCYPHYSLCVFVCVCELYGMYTKLIVTLSMASFCHACVWHEIYFQDWKWKQTRTKDEIQQTDSLWFFQTNPQHFSIFT